MELPARRSAPSRSRSTSSRRSRRRSTELQIKAAGRIRGLNNRLTNRKGMLEGLVKGGILAQKQANEKELAAWIAADPARQKEYGDVLPALAALQAETEKTRERDAVVRRGSSWRPRC